MQNYRVKDGGKIQRDIKIPFIFNGKSLFWLQG
jgi:hypothetical protein